MGSDFKVYDDAAVSLVICAIPIEDGLGSPFVKVMAVDDDFDWEAGIDGEVCLYNKHNTRFIAEVTLKGFSSHNAQLAAVHGVNTASSSGAGVGVFLLRDNNGSTIMAADKCCIQRVPDKGFGEKPEDVTWRCMIVASPQSMIVGGN
jgi:hypothetical protein